MIGPIKNKEICKLKTWERIKKSLTLYLHLYVNQISLTTAFQLPSFQYKHYQESRNSSYNRKNISNTKRDDNTLLVHKAFMNPDSTIFLYGVNTYEGF